LTSPTVNEKKVLFANLHAQLLLRVVELADSSAFGESAQSELSRVRARKFDDLKPGDVVSCVVRVASGAFVMRGNNLGRRIKATLKALDQDWTQRSCAKV
jgi:hypothetical protein